LAQLVEIGEFRLDLLFRLKIMHVTLPPLRERCGDATLLAAHFLQVCAERFGRGQKTLHPEAITRFEKYNWPGNIRELENLIYREYLLADGLTVDIEPLALANLERRKGIDRRGPNFSCANFTEAKNHAITNFEKYFLAEALTKAKGNVTKVASIVVEAAEKYLFGLDWLPDSLKVGGTLDGHYRFSNQPGELDDNSFQSLASTYSDVCRRQRAMADTDRR
jgi:two-component system response regulator GlrR